MSEKRMTAKALATKEGAVREKSVGVSESGRAYHHGALREALLQAAHDVIETDGVQAFSLRECARRAGVSHAAPAHHFGDRAGMLGVYVASSFNTLAERMQHSLANAGSEPFDRLKAIGRAYGHFAVENPQTYKLMFQSDNYNETITRAEGETGIDPWQILQQIIIECLATNGEAMSAQKHFCPPESGEAVQNEVYQKGVFLWSVVHGYVSLSLERKFTDIKTEAGRQTYVQLLENLMETFRPVFTGKSNP